MKLKSKNIRIAFWVMLGLVIAFTSLALNRPLPTVQGGTATPTMMADTIEAAAEVHEDVGSTDGIMLMAVVIVLIVIIPILLRRQAWAKGKAKK
jgi:Na+/H+ antiporter NhaC